MKLAWLDLLISEFLLEFLKSKFLTKTLIIFISRTSYYQLYFNSRFLVRKPTPYPRGNFFSGLKLTHFGDIISICFWRQASFEWLMITCEMNTVEPSCLSKPWKFQGIKSNRFFNSIWKQLCFRRRLLFNKIFIMTIYHLCPTIFN